MPPRARQRRSSVHQFDVEDADGGIVALGELLSGKVALICNVASYCGLTPQYKGLEELHRAYQSRGFTVIGFPCNQFLGQEPDDAAQVCLNMGKKFNVSFPILGKVAVNGSETHPLYNFMKKEKRGMLGTSSIKWNFTKFLVDHRGVPIKRYGPTTAPAAIEADIVKVLEDAQVVKNKNGLRDGRPADIKRMTYV